MNVYYITFPFILTLFTCISSFSSSLFFWRSFRHFHFVLPLHLVHHDHIPSQHHYKQKHYLVSICEHLNSSCFNICSLLGNTPLSIQKLRKSKYHNRLQAREHYSVSLFNIVLHENKSGSVCISECVRRGGG